MLSIKDFQAFHRLDPPGYSANGAPHHACRTKTAVASHLSSMRFLRGMDGLRGNIGRGEMDYHVKLAPLDMTDGGMMSKWSFIPRSLIPRRPFS